MKLFSKIGIFCTLLTAAVLTQTSCSGTADTEELTTSVSASAFADGQVNIVVYGPSAFVIAPTGRAATEEESGSVTITTGDLIVGETVVPVYYTYETLGNDANPTGAVLKVSLVDAAAYASNMDIINGLGLATSTRILSITIDYDFTTSRCDIVTTGLQTRTNAAPSTEDIFVTVAESDKAFNITAPNY